MKWLVTQFRKEEWSPYAAGALLGLVGILAVLLSDNLLGASGAFENVVGLDHMIEAHGPSVYEDVEQKGVPLLGRPYARQFMEYLFDRGSWIDFNAQSFS